jgi:hypothetical protein
MKSGSVLSPAMRFQRLILFLRFMSIQLAIGCSLSKNLVTKEKSLFFSLHSNLGGLVDAGRGNWHLVSTQRKRLQSSSGKLS